MKAVSIHPPERILMGPGPSNVHPRVLAALARPTIGHLDPEFLRMMDSIQDLLRATFRTHNQLTTVISGPGTAGMETCVVNLVEPGDTVVVCVNGVFGGRIQQMVERCGGRVVRVEDPWGRAIDPEKLERALRDHPEARLVAMVHAETSTGALSDVKTLVEIAHRYECLTLVDVVTSLGGCPVEVDAWGIDVVYGGSQKCLSCVPGLAPVSVSERARDQMARRRRPVQSWFMDLELLMQYWGAQTRRAYHHTAPVNALYAFHEALVLLHEEGLEQAWARHRLHHRALVAGLEAMGLEMVVPEEERIPQLNTVRVPDGVDEAAVRRHLLQTYGLEIGAGLGDLAGKVWRIGLMGWSCQRKNVELCLAALESVLVQMGVRLPRGAALEAAARVYAAAPPGSEGGA